MILCDKLLPNNVKFNLIYNFGMCSLFWRFIHFLYSKDNHFVYTFNFLYLKFIHVYSRLHCQKFNEFFYRFQSEWCKIWLNLIITKHLVLGAFGSFYCECTLTFQSPPISCSSAPCIFACHFESFNDVCKMPM